MGKKIITMRPTHSRQPQAQATPTGKLQRGKLHSLRYPQAFIIMAVALIALLSATVAIGQASQNYDLACRSILSAAGHTSWNATHAVTGALGMPIVPPRDSELNPTYAIRSTNFGLRAGFLPGYPSDLNAGTNGTSEEATPAQGDMLVQRLPIISKTLYIIRGGC